MTKFEAAVPTTHASRYLQQLCKHWSHRFEVAFDATHGTIEMNGARCTFQAGPERLLMVLESADDAALPILCDVVTEHLKRFAFREDIEPRWAEAAEA
jgi:hypothetical protein